jgi:hypothetical protein
MGRLGVGAVLSLLVVVPGCGGSDEGDSGWTPRAAVKDFDGDVAPGENIRRAEAIIRHHREDHCGQRLVEVLCEERTSRWDCRWRTDEGDGSTLLEKRPPNGVIVVSCG